MKPHVWSNAAYGVVVLVFAAQGLWTLAVSMMILSYTSWMGHLKGGKWWVADWIGMYVAFTAVILHNINHIEAWWFTAPLISLWSWFDHKESFLRIGGFWLAAVASSFWAGNEHTALSILFFSVGLWLRQRTPNMTDVNYDTYHSLWHLFTAVGIYLLTF